MKIINNAILLNTLLMAQCILIAETETDKRTKNEIKKANQILIGASVDTVIKQFGEPRIKHGDFPDQTWHYLVPLQSVDVAHIVGFTVAINGGKVGAVNAHSSDTLFISASGLIGNFAGYIGKDATQRDVILSFQSSKPLASLSREDKVRILQELQRRIVLAKQRGEKILLPRSCAFVKLAADILEKHGSPFAPFMLENELVVDLQREGEKIVLVLDRLAKPKLQDK